MAFYVLNVASRRKQEWEEQRRELLVVDTNTLLEDDIEELKATVADKVW